MVSSAQLRAARAHLDLSQSATAEGADVHLTTVSSAERGESNQATLDKLQRFYEAAGVEFLENEGVRLRSGFVRTYEGGEGMRRFFDDVYLTAKEDGGDISLYNGMPKELIRWLGADWYKMHAERMTAERRRFKFRVIVQEGEDTPIGADFAEYRTVPAPHFQNKTIYVYGGKTAFIDFKEDSVRIVVVEGKGIADSVRTLFNPAWEGARPL